LYESDEAGDERGKCEEAEEIKNKDNVMQSRNANSLADDMLVEVAQLSSPTKQYTEKTGFQKNPPKMKSCYKVGFETPTGLVRDRDRDLEHRKNRQG
jgi:hypothetical protein